MIKKSIGVVVALIMGASLLGACTGPPGLPGSPGLPGNPGQPGLPGPPGEVVQPMATITVMPVSGTSGTFITVIGAGFQPGEELKVEMIIGGISNLIGLRETKIDGERIQKVVADEYGMFRIISKIPRVQVAPPGIYAIEVTGDQGSFAVTPLEVVE